MLFRQGSCASDLGGSTLTLNPADNGSLNNAGSKPDEAFVYRETFANIFPHRDGTIKVSVWTIIDGQLIAKSTVTTLPDCEAG